MHPLEAHTIGIDRERSRSEADTIGIDRERSRSPASADSTELTLDDHKEPIRLSAVALRAQTGRELNQNLSPSAI